MTTGLNQVQIKLASSPSNADFDVVQGMPNPHPQAAVASPTIAETSFADPKPTSPCGYPAPCPTCACACPVAFRGGGRPLVPVPPQPETKSIEHFVFCCALLEYEKSKWDGAGV